jgi:hypothetical protein
MAGRRSGGVRRRFPLLLIGQASLDDLSQKVGRPLEMLLSAESGDRRQ